MSDSRLQYVAMRLEAALDGYLYHPAVSTFFDNAKVSQEVP